MFDPSWLDSIHPPPDPGSFPTPLADRLLDGADRLERLGEPELYPPFAWSLLVSQSSEQLIDLERSYPFVDRITFGFLEPEIDGEEMLGMLGIVVNVDPPQALLQEGGLHDVYMSDSRFVEVADNPFPVVVRVATTNLEVALTSPGSARATVWTTLHKSSTPTSGWLVPYHAVRSNNAAVSYSDGCTGRVVESLGACWDAVVASSTLTRPPSTSARAMVPIPGLSLQVTDQSGKQWTPSLTQVDVNIGLIGYSKAPIRMTYDWSTSARGDSGALVSDQSTTPLPVGMHQGTSVMRDTWGNALKESDGSDLRRAFGLCLYQIESTKDGEYFI
jgi:hypothetical protein